MITPEGIVAACWSIFVGFWLLNWRNVKPSQSRRWNMTWVRLVGVLILVCFVVLARRFLFLSPCKVSQTGCRYNILFSAVTIPDLQIVGVLLTILGLGIAIIARRTLGRNWSNIVDVKVDHELITNGIYSLVRHPIYLGFGLMGLGSALTFQSLGVWVYFIVLSLVFFFRIKREEDLMTKTFPKEYLEYKKRTKALIPFLY